MITVENLKDVCVYSNFMGMSLHSQLTAAQQEIARLEDANKALMDKLAEMDKKLSMHELVRADALHPIGGKAPHRDEYLPVGEVIEHELS